MTHLDRIRSIPCVVCMELGLGETPSEAHHLESVRDGNSDYAAVPLCTEHHRGATGVHGLRRRGFEAMYKLTEIDLLALTIRGIVRGQRGG